MIPRFSLGLLVVTAAVGLGGCSFSVSSESVSASLDSSSKAASSPSESSRGSSGGSVAAYQTDVRDYTAAYVRSGGDVEAFRGQLAEVARKRGITDWEASNATWDGVGEGLAKANVSGAAFESYLTSFTGADRVKMSAVRAAYERAKTK